MSAVEFTRTEMVFIVVMTILIALLMVRGISHRAEPPRSVQPHLTARSLEAAEIHELVTRMQEDRVAD